MKFKKHFVKLSNKTGILYAQTAYKSPGHGWVEYFNKDCSSISFQDDLTFTELATNNITVVIDITDDVALAVDYNYVVADGGTLSNAIKAINLLIGNVGVITYTNDGDDYVYTLNLYCGFVSKFLELHPDVTLAQIESEGGLNITAA